MRHLWMALALLAASCGGKTTDTGTGDDDDDAAGDDDDDDDDNGGGDPTADTSDDGGGGGGGLDPVAVGFELYGNISSDGRINPFFVQGTGYNPYVVLIFADLEFFSLSGDDQKGHYCTAFALFSSDPTYGDVQPTNNVPTFDNSPLFYSYETAIDVFSDPADHDCDELVDPVKWGEDAELLVPPFDGAHFGWGFGRLTDYLRDAWTKDTITEFEDSMLASYIAINDASGTWEAYDWTTSFAWEADSNTGELIVDGKGYLQPVDLSGFNPGDPLPYMYVQSYAYWYQDFPLMDFSNLKDGAP